MSVWTHVNCSIRIDGIDYGDLPKINNYSIPSGSEGPLEYHYNIVDTGMVLATLMIYGDLRDYEDIDEIMSWIKGITEDIIVRSGIMEIEVEYKKPIVLVYRGQDWVKI